MVLLKVAILCLWILQTTEAQFMAKFLVAVNATWMGPEGCVSIASTETLKLGEKGSISIGKCDFGPIYYEIQHNQHPGPLQDFANNTIHITFESHDVMDASHPTCDLHFNETYIVPQTHLLNRRGIYSPLPSCYTADSREGANMTYFWFFLLELTRC